MLKIVGFLTKHRHLFAIIIFLLIVSITLPITMCNVVENRETEDKTDNMSFVYDVNSVDVSESIDDNSNPSQDNTNKISIPKNSFDYTKICDFDTLEKWVYYFSRKYKDILKLYYYGESVQGRKLYVLTLGTGNRKVLINAGIHSREHITVNFTLRTIEDYCEAYYNSGFYGSYDLKKLFSEFTVYIIPNCNPDGVEIISGKASPSVSTVIDSYNSFKANANGVNLNRNFPYYWSTVNMGSDVPHQENFKGYSHSSEPETHGLISLCKSNNFEFMISLHIKGDCIYWGDVKNKSNVGWDLTKKLCNNLGFSACDIVNDPNLYGGCFENWFAKTFNRPGLCVELMPVEITSIGNSDTNLKNFDTCVRWDHTRYLLATALNHIL